jgi:hypothetical protein
MEAKSITRPLRPTEVRASDKASTTPPNFEAETTEVALGARTHKVSAPKDLLEVIARSTACSSIVFAGLLAWASLDAHRPLKEEI